MEGVWADDFEDDDFLDNYGEAIEVPDPEKRGQSILIDALGSEKGPAKPKRVVQNPRPKLDTDRMLATESGLPKLVLSAYDIMLKPGKEIEDLRRTLALIERWAHRVFPKYTFKDFLEKSEGLGKKRPVKTHLRKCRTGLIPS